MSEFAEIRSKISGITSYNLHTHTQFCDGHSTMEEIMEAARRENFHLIGFSPHAPLFIPSPCNMPREKVNDYFAELERLRVHYPEIAVYAGMEIDFLSADDGPHIDYFQKLPLDYRIGSVHFVPTQDGGYADCDGSPERFQKYLSEFFHDDLQYVVETFLTDTLLMIERGGFDILGHFDKIAANASSVDPEIETRPWYQALIKDIISNAADCGLAVEINTKSLKDKRRFFPAESLIQHVVASGAEIVVNSDAHWADRLNSGRPEAFEILDRIKN